MQIDKPNRNAAAAEAAAEAEMQRVQKRFARDMNRAAVIDRLECGRMRGKTPIHPPARRLGY